jgi:hypothetical protein
MMMDTKRFSGLKIDEVSGTVKAVIATLGVVDKDRDVTRKGAFGAGQDVVISAYQHTSWDGALPVGTGRIYELDDEVIFDGKFLLETAHGRDTFATVKAMSEAGLQEWSYSLHDVESERGTHDGKAVTFLNRISVKEVSPVLIGAGVNTRTLTIKAEGQPRTFSEHSASVLADLGALTVRASEVVALRAEKGKSLSDESAALLGQVEKALDELKQVLTPAPIPSGDEIDITGEYLRFVATTQGVQI